MLIEKKNVFSNLSIQRNLINRNENAARLEGTDVELGNGVWLLGSSCMIDKRVSTVDGINFDPSIHRLPFLRSLSLHETGGFSRSHLFGRISSTRKKKERNKGGEKSPYQLAKYHVMAILGCPDTEI